MDRHPRWPRKRGREWSVTLYVVGWERELVSQELTEIHAAKKIEKRHHGQAYGSAIVSQSTNNNGQRIEWCLCSESKWSSDLLRSSKTIGRPKQSAREQLRQAFLEQKAGVNITDTSNARLFVEKEIEEEETSAIASSSNNKATKPQQPQSTPVVGSALKQTDGTPAMPLTKRKRKKKQVRKEDYRSRGWGLISFIVLVNHPWISKETIQTTHGHGIRRIFWQLWFRLW